MSRLSPRKTKLLAEAFHDDWEGAPADFARAAAAHARRRRQARRALLAAGGSVALAVAALALWPQPADGPATRGPLPVAAAAAAMRGYEIISDDELLTRLQDQPVLVVKRANGTKEITLLGTPPEAGSFDE